MPPARRRRNEHIRPSRDDPFCGYEDFADCVSRIVYGKPYRFILGIAQKMPLNTNRVNIYVYFDGKMPSEIYNKINKMLKHFEYFGGKVVRQNVES